MTKEMWKPVVGYEDLYEVSNIGRVRSLDRKICGKNGSFRLIPGKVLKPALLLPKNRKKGYLRVRLGDGKNKKSGKWYLVHILLWTSFIGPIPKGYQINHIDEDGTNNCLENLCLMTPKANNSWGTRVERVKKANTNGKCSKPVLVYDLQGNYLGYYPSANETARQLNLNVSWVSRVCTGKKTHYKQYVFKYKS